MKNKLTDKLIEIDIIQAIGLDNLPDNEKMKLIENFSETIFQATMLRVAVGLMGPDREKFDMVVDAGDEEEMGKFLDEKVPDIESIATDEALKFKKNLIERFQEIEERIQASKNNQSQ